MSVLAELLQRLAERPPDVRADFVGHLAFQVVDDVDPAALPPDVQRDLARFIERVGFEEDDDAHETRARIDRHFRAHPVDAELLQMFANLDEAIAADAQADAADQGRAASEVLGAQASIQPVGAAGRAPGTMGGGLAGLLAARTGRAPTVALPAAPKGPVSR